MAQWLESLRTQPKHRTKCIKYLALLRDRGYDLRRPHADLLRDGIRELRVQFSFENYRMLYFFYGRDLAVLTHGITKHQDETPPGEIDKAVRLSIEYGRDPESHTFYWEP